MKQWQQVVAYTAIGVAGAVAVAACAQAVLGRERPTTHDVQPPIPYAVVYPPRGTAPLRVRLDGSGSADNVGVTAWHWDFDDGTTGEGAIVDHVYASARTYHPTLVVEDAAGSFRGLTQTVEVITPSHDRRAPVARIAVNVSRGQVPLTVAFDGRGSTDDLGVTRCQWEFGDGTTGEGERAQHRFVSPGRYLVQLQVSDASGHTAKAALEVSADAQPAGGRPMASITASAEKATATAEIRFDARGSRNVIDWQWDFGDGGSASGPAVSHRYTHQGEFVVALVARDGSGQWARSSRVVHILEPTNVTERVLFDDEWASGIADDPEGVTTTLSADAHAGRHALIVTPRLSGSLTARFQAESFDAYDRLGFWVDSDEPDATAVRVLLADGTEGPIVPVEPFLLPGAGGQLRKAWRRAAIPLGALGAEHKAITGIRWQAAAQDDLPEFALDDVALLPPDEALPVLSECTVPPAIHGFVQREDGQLMADGVPFRAVGANLYYVQQELARHIQTGEVRPLAHVRSAMTAAVCAGANVVRILGFNDSPPETQDGTVIQTSPGVLREEGLRGLDLAIAEAASHHLRVILTLTNNWGAFGGIPRYAQWAHDDPADAMDDPRVRDWIVDYSTALAERVNTFTGVRYSEDPTILAVELANELRCRDCESGHDATALALSLAQGVSEAWPNHLIADGGEGFDDDAERYPGLADTSVVDGTEGTSFRALADAPEIDLLSYHLYPQSWNLTREQALDYIDAHESIARAAGKVAYMGEFGLQTQDQDRAAIYDEWLQRLFVTDSGSLALVWQLTYPGRPDDDGFALVPGASGQALGAIARAARMLSLPELDGVSLALLRKQ